MFDFYALIIERSFYNVKRKFLERKFPAKLCFRLICE